MTAMRNYILDCSKGAAALSFLAVLCVTAAVSCVRVDYGYVDEGEGAPEGFGTSGITLDFSWPQSDGSALPEQMTVAIARKVNETHYVWSVDRTGLPSGTEETLEIRNGDYYAVAFNVPENGYTLNGLDKFREDDTYSLARMSASVPTVNAGVLKTEYGISAGEFCPEYPVVETVQPLWHSVSGLSSGRTVIPFAPQDLTVELDIRIKLNTVSGASVSAVTAALAGVPSSVSLMSGEVTGTSLRKAVFRMEESGTSGQNTVYSGKVRTLGAFSSGSGSFLAGPGILWIAVDASAGAVERRLYAGINIRSMIAGQKIMEKTAKGNGYKVVKNAATVEVGTVLTIDGDRIISGDGAVEGWQSRTMQGRASR